MWMCVCVCVCVCVCIKGSPSFWNQCQSAGAVMKAFDFVVVVVEASVGCDKVSFGW